MFCRATSLASVALLGVTPLLSAQQPLPIGRPTAEFAEPFSRVSGLRELADGRLIVSDQRDKIVQLVDLRSGAATKISREGAGPGEYALPGALYAMPNNQSLLVDLQNRRFLMIGPDGKPGETISPPQLTPSATGPGGRQVQIGGLVNPRGVDRQGRLYFQDFGLRPEGGTSPDSVAILRWAPGTTRVDTAAWIRPPQTTMTSSPAGGAGQTVRMTIGSSIVWTPQETWGVAADGSVARVIPEPYRIGWYGANRRMTAGPVVPYTPIRVTEADKAEFREQQRANPPTMIMMGGGGGGGGGTPVAPQMPEPTFAETKPPFTGTVLVAPEGEVWVLRTRRAGDKIPVYDIFDASGRLSRKISLAAGSRVVGFGTSSVYVVRTDEDDLEYIQRFARAVPGQP